MVDNKKYNTRKLILFPIIGLLILTSISYIIDFGVRHSDFEQTGKVNKIINHSIDPGIMIFGPSVSEVSISPSILEEKTHLTAYNCSLNGTRFTQYQGLIEEFESYTRNNEYIILVESYFSFEKIDLLMSVERYVSQINNRNLYSSLFQMQPDLIWKCRYIPFYKYVAVSHGYYKNSVIGWKQFLGKGKFTDTLSGWYPVDRNWEVDEDEAMQNTKPFAIAIDSEIVKRYIEMVNKLKSSGKKVILLLSPPYTERLKKITDFTPLRKELNMISSKTGAKFLDFTNSNICADKTLFYNTNHLNLKGSVIFSNILADSLNKIIHSGEMR